jgi:hypothetical protein
MVSLLLGGGDALSGFFVVCHAATHTNLGNSPSPIEQTSAKEAVLGELGVPTLRLHP